MSNFPSKDNPQPCKNICGTKIYLAKKGSGGYLPYELDDSIHNCPKRQPINSNQEPPTQPKQMATVQQPRPELQNREAKLAHIVESIQTILKELESLK